MILEGGLWPLKINALFVCFSLGNRKKLTTYYFHIQKVSLFSERRENDYASRDFKLFKSLLVSTLCRIKKSCRHVCFTSLPKVGTMKRLSKTNSKEN